MEIKILYGTETGNSESLAKEAKTKLTDGGFNTEVLDMKDVNAQKLANFKNVLIITSTWGDGEPPDNAESLYNELKDASGLDFSGLSFAVLALGQSFYEHFCKTGKDFDEWLEKYGAKRILPLQLSDDDFNDIFPEWIQKVQNSFK